MGWMGHKASLQSFSKIQFHFVGAMQSAIA